MGGLGVRDPIELCDVEFTSSQAVATVISDAVRGFTELDWSEHLECKLLLFLTVKEYSLGIMIDYTRF